MLIPAPPLYPRKRKPRPKAQPTPPAPPVALVLVSAVYEGGAAVTLTFDRPIDIAGLDGSSVIVDDG